MAPIQMRLRVTIGTGHGDVGLLLLAQSTDRIADVVERLVRECGLTGGTAGWQLLFADRILPANRTLREVVPSALDPAPLTLRPAGGSAAVQAPAATRAAVAAPTAAPTAAGVEVQAAADTLSARELDPVITPSDRTRPPAGGPAAGRALVRYHCQMSANRVYPLVVMLTRDDVARLVQRHVEQRGAGVKLTLRSPLEIEPVLPGCTVYPPKIATRIDAAEELFRFHVVPQVVGTITGARVVIRQDNATLTELDLDMFVAQRTWVWLSGLATVALPVASSAMRHFGVDFQASEGVGPVFAVMRFLFAELQPVILAGVLALLTLGLWWWTRPIDRDEPWDVARPPA